MTEKYFVIEMPYNEGGGGPEMDATKVAGIDYEVWDHMYLNYGYFHTREEAQELCDKLNDGMVENLHRQED